MAQKALQQVATAATRGLSRCLQRARAPRRKYAGRRVIVIDEKLFDQIMRGLRSSSDPGSIEAARNLKCAAIESLTRELEFNNEAPALLMRQAG
jgi:hypothetical protein